MRLLLDTQIFVELSQYGIERFSSRVRKHVDNEDNDLFLSAISITEIAVKASINKLALTAPGALTACDDLRLIVIPFELRHAIRLFDLALHHRDPFARMLIATALSDGAPIITADDGFRSYRGLKVIN